MKLFNTNLDIKTKHCSVSEWLVGAISILQPRVMISKFIVAYRHVVYLFYD
jgi:hypothetical protein